MAREMNPSRAAMIAICIVASIILFAMHESAAANGTNCPASDQALWRNSEFALAETNLQTCGLSSLGLAASARSCLSSRSQLSASCIECQVSLIVCTSQNCVGDCANGGRTNTRCRDCVDAKCDNSFTECSNLPFPTCNECVQPASDGGFIPGLEQGAAIGVVVGGAAGLILCALVVTYFVCVRDSRVDFKPSQRDLISSPELGKQPSFHTNGSPQMGHLKLYANSDDASSPAYAAGVPPNSQVRPFDPIMQEI